MESIYNSPVKTGVKILLRKYKKKNFMYISPVKSIVKILLRRYKILTDRRNRFAFP
jgi:hypothetical protein